MVSPPVTTATPTTSTPSAGRANRRPARVLGFHERLEAEPQAVAIARHRHRVRRRAARLRLRVNVAARRRESRLTPRSLALRHRAT